MDIVLLQPADAPSGLHRLLPVLQDSLSEPDYEACRIVVAFARVSGIARLLPHIRAWRSRRRLIEAVVGIDLLGTSLEALQALLNELDAVYITRASDASCTFHPKMYLFEGGRRARAIVGSHNLTSSGLETNYEGGVIVDFSLPAEVTSWQPFREAWGALLPEVNPSTRQLDGALIEALVGTGQIVSEKRMRIVAQAAEHATGVAAHSTEVFPAHPPAPPSPISAELIPGSPALQLARRRVEMPPEDRPETREWLPRALVTEIKPHHNGEIFLSKTAADSFPAFFGMPFTGQTVPKVAGNPSYPMREPDPIVEWCLYDGRDRPPLYRDQFALNTVFYERKSEIRITVTPGLARATPQYSVMVMWGGPSSLAPGLDYLVEVFVPGSPEHSAWQEAMNITLPSGGSTRSRRMGWI